MPKVTGIEAQKNRSDRYSIHVDGEYLFSLSGQQLIDEKIRIGLELGDDDIERIQIKAEISLLLAKAVEKAVRRPHSVKEMRDYLWKNTKNEEDIQLIINKLSALKLLDDEVFAQAFVRDRRKFKNRSDAMLRQELYSRGVDKTIIDRVIQDSPGSDQQSLQNAITKKIRTNKTDEKIIANLARQGFRYSEIKTELARQRAE